MKKLLIILAVVIVLIWLNFEKIENSFLRYTADKPFAQKYIDKYYDLQFIGKTLHNYNVDVNSYQKYDFANTPPLGDMPSLYVAVDKDKTGELKSLAEKFMEFDTNENDRFSIIEKMLYKMTNSENIDESSRGEYINAKHLNVLEKTRGRKFYSTYDASHNGENPRNPNLVAGQLLEDGYNILKLYYYALMMNKILNNDGLTKKYTLSSDSYSFRRYSSSEYKDVKEELKRRIENDRNSGEEKVYQLAAVLKGFGLWNQYITYGGEKVFNVYDDNCLYTLFTQNDRDLKWKIDSLAKVPLEQAHESKQASECYRAADDEELDGLHLRKGDDVIYGGNGNDVFTGGSGDDILDGGDGSDIIDGWLDDDIIYGGSGNDILRGGQGNDIIIAGGGDDEIYPDHNDENETADGDDIIRGDSGNDTIISTSGNDIYIFNEGDGNDTVSDKEGKDTFYFGGGIRWEDLSFSKQDDDMLITLKGTKDSILVKDWFKGKDYIIENFKFKNTTAHRADEIKIE